MLRSVKSLKGASVRTTDGECGSVEEFYFDDEAWMVRYLVVRTGGWLLGRSVLIAPRVLGTTDWSRNALQVNLTREQVAGSPGIATDRPVSRQWEADYHDYYGWPYYWAGGGMWGAGHGYPAAAIAYPLAEGAARREGAEPETAEREMGEWGREEADSHLRSTREVTGYTLCAEDGDLGHIEDFILEDTSWEVRYLSVDPSNWWPGKKVLILPRCIESIGWPDRRVIVGLTRDEIQNAPAWDPWIPIRPDYEELLRAYYEGRNSPPTEAQWRDAA